MEVFTGSGWGGHSEGGSETSRCCVWALCCRVILSTLLEAWFASLNALYCRVVLSFSELKAHSADVGVGAGKFTLDLLVVSEAAFLACLSSVWQDIVKFCRVGRSLLYGIPKVTELLLGRFRRGGYGVCIDVGASVGLVVGTLLDIVTPSQAVTALSRHIVFQVEVIQ